MPTVEEILAKYETKSDKTVEDILSKYETKPAKTVEDILAKYETKPAVKPSPTPFFEKSLSQIITPHPLEEAYPIKPVTIRPTPLTEVEKRRFELPGIPPAEVPRVPTLGIRAPTPTELEAPEYGVPPPEDVLGRELTRPRPAVITEKPKITDYLKMGWVAAKEPAKDIREWSSKMLGKIEGAAGLAPEEQDKFWKGFFSGMPRLVAETGVDYLSLFVEPETLLLSGFGRGLTAFSKTPAGRFLTKDLFKETVIIPNESIPNVIRKTVDAHKEAVGLGASPTEAVIHSRKVLREQARVAREEALSKPVVPGEPLPKIQAREITIERTAITQMKEMAGKIVKPKVKEPAKITPIETEIVTPAPAEVPGVTPITKEPWQMTREEFIKWNILPSGERRIRFGAQDARKGVIENAINSGKPVPPEVLKDYPELVKITPKPVVELPYFTERITKVKPEIPEPPMKPAIELEKIGIQAKTELDILRSIVYKQLPEMSKEKGINFTSMAGKKIIADIDNLTADANLLRRGIYPTKRDLKLGRDPNTLLQRIEEIKRNAEFLGFPIKIKEVKPEPTTIPVAPEKVEIMAENYAKALEQPINDYHKKFAQSIINKDAEFLTSIIAQGKGQNEVSKKFFTQETGIKLPTTMQGKKETIYNWAKKEVIPSITKELELLAQEARKYKSAEEFVKADKDYQEKVKQTQKAMESRANLLPGSSRAKVTTANARWSQYAESRDLREKELTDIWNKVVKEVKEVKPVKVAKIQDVIISETEKKIATENYNVLPLASRHPESQSFSPSETVRPEDREFMDRIFSIQDVNLAREKLVRFIRSIGANVAEQQRKMRRGVVGVTKKIKNAENRIRLSYINDLSTLSHEAGHQLHIFLTGAGENIPKFVDKNRPEFMRISQYVRPLIGETDIRHLKYRKYWSELFGDFFSMYLYHPGKLKELSPNITEKIDGLIQEYNFTDAINDLRKTDDISDKPPIEIGKMIEEQISLFSGTGQDFGTKVSNLLGTPFYRGMNKESFAPVINAVIDNLLYSRYGLMNKEVELLNWEKFKGFPEESRKRIIKALFDGNLPNIKHYLSPQELRKTPYTMTDLEITEYNRLVDFIKQGQQDLLVEYGKWKSGYYKPGISPEEQESMVMDINKRLSAIDGYIPIFRDNTGKYKIYAESEDGIGFFNTYKTIGEAERQANALKEQGYPLVNVYKKGEVAREALNRYNRLPSMDLHNLLESEGIDLTNPQVKHILSIMERSAIPMFLRRDWVPGYEQTENALRDGLISFAETSINLLTKTKARRMGAEALGKISTKDALTYNYASKYLDDAFTTNRNELVFLSRCIYTYYLAWNIKFMGVNLLQPTMMTKPMLVKELGFLKGYKAFVNGYVKSTNKELRSPELNTFLERAKNEGVLQPVFTKEVFRNVKDPETTLQKTVKTGGDILSLGTAVTEIVNRKHALISFYEAGKQKGLSGEELYDYMKRGVNATQVIYGKFNLPELIRRSGALYPVVKSGWTFMTFIQTYFSELLYLSRKAPFTAGLDAWITLLLLAGVMGIPGGVQLLKLIRNKTKKDPWLEMRMKNEMVADLVWRGLPAAIGIDISRSAGLGDMFNRVVDLDNLVMGVYSGIYKRMKYGYEDLKKDKTLDALVNFSPIFLANPLDVYRMIDEQKRGLPPTTMRTAIPFTPTKKELITKTLGIQPTRFSVFYALENYTRFLQREKTRMANEFNTRFVEAINKGDEKGIEKVASDLIKYNNELPEDLKPELSLKFSRSSIKSALIRARVGIKRMPRTQLGGYLKMKKELFVE